MTDESATGLRSKREMLNLTRWMWENHFRREKERAGEEERGRRAVLPEKKPLRRKIVDLVRNKWTLWLWTYIRSRFGRKHPFLDYSMDSDRGIYALAGGSGLAAEDHERIRVSLAADWATGTSEAREVAECMKKFDPHFTIHLGDTYFVGDPAEVRSNFFDLVEWPLGSRGSFALNGNHEMYARGIPYFRDLLPRLGIRGAAGTAPLGQKASFFCLENQYWRIVGLDTGYHSIDVPFFEKFLFRPAHKLNAKLIDWLRHTVRLQDDRTHGIILLSHHQYFSAFESGYPKAANQLREFLDRPVLWFWGHEHRMAFYGRHAEKDGLEAYGRCVGHAAMPVEDIRKEPAGTAHGSRLVLYDHREAPDAATGSGSGLGFNGFVNLTFEADRLSIEYRDLEDRLLITEEWQTDRASGRLHGLGITTHVDGLSRFSSSLSDAQA